MIPAIPQPDPLALPAPFWLLWTLLLLTFLLHLIPMNLVLGGSILGAIARLRGRRPDRPHEAALARLVVKAMPVLIAATVSLGVAALLFLQVLYGRLFFPSAIVMGWWWMSVIGLLVVMYYAAYLLAFRGASLGSAGTAAAWVIAAIAGLIALIYSTNMTLMLKPAELVAGYAAGTGGFTLGLAERTLIPRYLHMVNGAVAVSGLAICFVGAVRRTQDSGFSQWAMHHGALACVGATVAGSIAGIWWLVALPPDVRARFLGDDARATGELAVGIVLTLAGAAHAWLAGRSARPVRMVTTGAVAMLAGLLLMLLTRDSVRRATLELAGFQPVNWSVPQWGPIVIFVVLLAAAVTAIGWMTKALVTAK